MAIRDLLIEVGTEELPPKSLNSLSNAFESLIVSGLAAENLSHGSSHRFATPRRLAVLVRQVEENQSDREVFRVGPAVTAAYNKDGKATPAALGFSKSCGVELEHLTTTIKNGVEKLAYQTKEKGQQASALIPGIITSSLKKLPTPKRMRWGSSREEFVRPIHWCLLLFGQEKLDLEIFGVCSNNKTRGHRFLNNTEILVDTPSQYESVLLEIGQVIPDFEKRRENIRAQVIEEGKLANALTIVDEELLEEVTSLVEYPTALTGEFDPEFLQVPSEALILAMKTHQKCFHMTDQNGVLLPKFIAVSNIRSEDPSQVIKGNERVIRPRMADAKFFFETDKQTTLETRLEKLKNLVFQNELGSVYDKVVRVSKICTTIAQKLSANGVHCERAALLSKCDLLTDMVREFSDLQGIVGSYYANHDGEPKEVAEAIGEHYHPRYSGDNLPASDAGSILALSDKLDTIVALFGINQPPTGSKDPFGLRRSAIGLLRIIVEKKLDLNIVDAIRHAISTHNHTDLSAHTEERVFQFLLERFRSWYQDEGVSNSVFESVYVLKPERPLDFNLRIEAVNAFNKLPEAMSLAIANKRVSNLLKKQLHDDIKSPCNKALLNHDSEKNLFIEIKNKKLEMAPLIEDFNYTEALLSLSSLKPMVDDFFDKVLVIDEDRKLRENRLSLLSELRELFLMTADISFLDPSS